jgi:hypothetical protein
MVNKTKYLQLTSTHSRLPLFFQPWWLDAVCKTWDIAIQEKDGQIAALFPYQVEKKAGLTLLRNPPLTPYLGPLFLLQHEQMQAQWDFEEKMLEQLWQQFPKWDFFQVETRPGFQNFLPFHQKGFSNTNRLTYYLDLQQPEEALFANIHSRRRNYIRKAEKEIVIEVEAHPNIDLLVSWHRQAFKQKKQYYPFSAALVDRLIRSSNREKASLFLTAKDVSGNPLAMLWTPFDSEKTYHLLSAYNPQQPVKGLMDLLTWTAVKAARQRGQMIYDFEGSMEPGIESFFRKFGGQRKTYLSFQQNRSMLWRLKRALLG